jgi:hypothetical protein
MFGWLRRIFQRSDYNERQILYQTVDALNAAAGGGQPSVTTRFLGHLKLRSSTVVLGDPQFAPELEIPNIVGAEIAISATLWSYPSGEETVTALKIWLGDARDGGPPRKIGEVGIDSAKLALADKADIEDHWAEVGKDRIGVISTARNDTVLRKLTKRFRLQTVRVNPVRAQVVGPVSEELTKEIEGYLKEDPEYADYPFLYFRVQTNNSFERALFVRKAWDFIPVGNADAPLMFVCGTGRGDGVYDVQCTFSTDVPCLLSITFIEDVGG